MRHNITKKVISAMLSGVLMLSLAGCGKAAKLPETVVNTSLVVEKNGNRVCVKVGSVFHPMTEEHLIQWIVLETSQGWQQKALAAGDAPEVKFALAEGEAPVAVWGYCNLHGLWKTVI